MDLVLADQQEDYFFETEWMLGKLDESHIIRAIEYWDLANIQKNGEILSQQWVHLQTGRAG